MNSAWIKIKEIFSFVYALFIKYRKLGYTISSLLFFLANYQICQYLYPLEDPGSVRNWWIMKVNIYILGSIFCYFSASVNWSDDLKLRKIEKLMIGFAKGFVISNFIDRTRLGDNEFTSIDLMLLMVITIISYFTPTRIKKNSEKHFIE
jgi:hypothetical protein